MRKTGLLMLTATVTLVGGAFFLTPNRLHAQDPIEGDQSCGILACPGTRETLCCTRTEGGDTFYLYYR